MKVFPHTYYEGHGIQCILMIINVHKDLALSEILDLGELVLECGNFFCAIIYLARTLLTPTPLFAYFILG